MVHPNNEIDLLKELQKVSDGLIRIETKLQEQERQMRESSFGPRIQSIETDIAVVKSRLDSYFLEQEKLVASNRNLCETAAMLSTKAVFFSAFAAAAISVGIKLVSG